VSDQTPAPDIYAVPAMFYIQVRPHSVLVEVNAMMSKEQNELITRVGPGTKCGALMRHY